MTVIEAMACGLPVLISNKVGIYKEIEKNKAGIIVDTNSESIYNGIKLILENHNLRKEIVSNGERLVEEYYNIDKVSDMIISAFEKIIRDAKFRKSK